jgi:hypothetical protein
VPSCRHERKSISPNVSSRFDIVVLIHVVYYIRVCICIYLCTQRYVYYYTHYYHTDACVCVCDKLSTERERRKIIHIIVTPFCIKYFQLVKKFFMKDCRSKLNYRSKKLLYTVSDILNLQATEGREVQYITRSHIICFLFLKNDERVRNILYYTYALVPRSQVISHRLIVCIKFSSDSFLTDVLCK